VEDAFQATFLALLKKASSLRVRNSLAGWLFVVARRAALRARADASRWCTGNIAVEGVVVDASGNESELRTLVHEELARLAEKYRSPLVLCYLEGKTHAEAAQELGWPRGSMARRLERGQELLRTRLGKRGITLASGTVTALMTEKAHALPTALMNTTLEAATAGFPASIQSLADASLPHAFPSAKAGAALVGSLFLIALGSAVAPFHSIFGEANCVVAAPVTVDEKIPKKEAGAGDWTMFRGNPLQTGVAAPAPVAFPDKLEELWKFKTKDAIENAGIIVGDMVYIGSTDENFYALKLKDGTEKWRYKAGPFKAPPSYRGGNIYIGDADGKMHCLEAATGKKRWIYDTDSEIVSGVNFVGDSILFGAGDETLYCLSADGKERWKFRVPGGPVIGTPAVIAGRTFVAGCDSNLHVIDADKGKELLAVPLEGQTAASAACADDRIFLGTMTNQVLAIDWKKGEVVWKFEPGRGGQPFYASAAVVNDLVITASRDKRVYAINRKTGAEVWRFQTKGRVEGSPVIVGSRVYIGSMDGNLYVLDLTKGTELQRIALGKPISASPAVAHQVLIIGSTDGTVYCFGAKK
jgi:RNA polymerase sigma factor (sigma-70 family)